MKNTTFKEILFKHWTITSFFIYIVDIIVVGLFPCLKNAKLTGICRYGDGGNPFN